MAVGEGRPKTGFSGKKRWASVPVSVYSFAVTDLTEFFGPNSPLRDHLPGFQPRAGQAWMAEAVAEAIANSGRLVVEAGTGTGKTFAYLLPALLSGRKTIISTGTKALQDQLYHRDLPLVCKAMGRPVTTALLKGRANYLCLHRLDQVTEPAASIADDLSEVREWRYRTTSGDKAELSDVPEDSPVWPLVTSTADNCLGQKCPEYAKCHVAKARKAAQEADLVVVNHHLLLADLAMKEEGFVEFLPGAEAVIIDEAHQIPDLAVQFFGVALGSRELERVLDDLRLATLPYSQAELNRRVDKFQTAIRALRADAPRKEGRHELGAVIHDIREALDTLSHAIYDVQVAVADMGDASIELEKIHDQLLGIGERLGILTSEDSLGRIALAGDQSTQPAPAPDPAGCLCQAQWPDRQRFPGLDLYIGNTGRGRRLLSLRRSHGARRRGRADVSESLPGRRERADFPATGTAAAVGPRSYRCHARGRYAVAGHDCRRDVLPVYESSRTRQRQAVVPDEQVGAQWSQAAGAGRCAT